MKKLTSSLVFLLALVLSGLTAFADAYLAAPNQIAVADTVKYGEYAGSYKMEGMPFDRIELTDKDGKLHYVAGEYQGELLPKTAKDEFDANGQATVKFTRDSSNMVKGIILNTQGQDFTGMKEKPKMDAAAYAGQYKMEGLPFETMEIKATGEKLLINAMGEEGELTSLAAPDQFDAAGRAVLKFTRDAGGKVTGVTLDAQGQSFTGVKK